MNLRDKKEWKPIDYAYKEKDVDHHLANFVRKIVAAKQITKGKIFKILKEEFGEKK